MWLNVVYAIFTICLKSAFIKVVEEEEEVEEEAVEKKPNLFSSVKRNTAVCDVGQQHPCWVYCIEVYWGKYMIRKLSKLRPITSQVLLQLSSGSRWIRGINPKNSTKGSIWRAGLPACCLIFNNTTKARHKMSPLGFFLLQKAMLWFFLTSHSMFKVKPEEIFK